MLKSTHICGRESSGAQIEEVFQARLPSPWTEHIAPSGHTYYYNLETKTSTYTRPLPPQERFAYHPEQVLSNVTRPSHFPSSIRGDNEVQHERRQRGFGGRNERNSSRVNDRPKSRHAIPDCQPWLLIKTKLGRRFVHNPVTNESFWKFPEDVAKGVVEFDVRQREKQVEGPVRPDRSLSADHPQQIQGDAPTSPGADVSPPSQSPSSLEPAVQRLRSPEKESEDEYEEVEVTDSEAEGEDGPSTKQQRLTTEDEEGADRHNAQNMTFDEDDMARQLAQMGENYDLDPEEYGNGMDEEDYSGDADTTAVTEEEARLGFMEILDDYRINPYNTWENVIADGSIIEDDRYTLLSNMKSRQDVFLSWSSQKIQAIKREKEAAVKQNPRIPYLNFLQQHASVKLFWPEFRRKFKKEPGMLDSKLNDKERERIYRDYIHQITKVTEKERQSNLETLLKSIPPSTNWNRFSTSRGNLPVALVTDVRYITLKPEARARVIETYILSLPDPAELKDRSDGSPNVSKQQEEALRRRGLQVEMDRGRQQRELAQGRGRLQAGEEELRRAMHVGNTGLREHIQEPA